jgi:hypothetical protein
MITEDEKAEIKKVLGYRYAHDVQKNLSENGYLNNNGLQYSTVQIRNVMSGISHAIIEDAIWKVFAEKKKLKKDREALLNA